jgi:hypothetical protein
VEDAVDRAKDKAAEIKAEAKVKEAKAKRESVHRRKEAKGKLRGD